MSITSRFLDADVLQASVHGCPLTPRPPREDTSACVSCRFNVAAPGIAQPGCTSQIPDDVFTRAEAALRTRAPELARELVALRNGACALTGASSDTNAQRWLALAGAWYSKLGPRDGDELEIAMVIARFARGALERQRPVELLRVIN
ncbi:hypothetical protein L6R52_28690 [Myxococcota bacterium]|nr:hypothetical protein [Myxococcota bacterium]